MPEPMVPGVTGTLDDDAVAALTGWVRAQGLGSEVTDNRLLCPKFFYQSGLFVAVDQRPDGDLLLSQSLNNCLSCFACGTSH